METHGLILGPEEKFSNQPQIEVEKKNMKRIIKVGTSSDDGVRVAKRLARLYVTKFAPDYTEDELKAYIKRKIKIDAKCTKMVSRSPEFYSSFKVEAQCEDPNIFMDPATWTKGIYYNWYRQPTVTSRPHNGE